MTVLGFEPRPVWLERLVYISHDTAIEGTANHHSAGSLYRHDDYTGCRVMTPFCHQFSLLVQLRNIHLPIRALCHLTSIGLEQIFFEKVIANSGTKIP